MGRKEISGREYAAWQRARSCLAAPAAQDKDTAGVQPPERKSNV